jgi:hypothetical protein
VRRAMFPMTQEGAPLIGQQLSAAIAQRTLDQVLFEGSARFGLEAVHRDRVEEEVGWTRRHVRPVSLLARAQGRRALPPTAAESLVTKPTTKQRDPAHRPPWPAWDVSAMALPLPGRCAARRCGATELRVAITRATRRGWLLYSWGAVLLPECDSRCAAAWDKRFRQKSARIGLPASRASWGA